MDGKGSNAAANHYVNVACPFCGILCDDLEIGPDGNSLKVLKNGCSKAIAGFERNVHGAEPQIDGRSATLGEAIAKSAELIRGSRLPVFGGLGTDVHGVRAVMSLADLSGGVVDHALSESSYRNYRVLQTGGWVMTTLTEARNRADLFVIAGCDLAKIHPRFFERIVCNEASMFAEAPAKRTVVFIGDALDPSIAQGTRIGDVVHINAKNDRIGEVINALRALAKGAAVTGDTIGGVPRSEIEDLLARCQAASYGVVVWSPSSLDFADADLTVQAVAEFVKDLNMTSRFAGLALGGNEGSVSAGAVCTWQSGFPLRVSFASGKPDYDVERYSAARLVADGETDLLIWLASFSPDLKPPPGDVPTIVLGTPGLNLAGTPRVFIPIGTPGADHAGHLIRVDSVIALPLQNLHRSSLPSAAAVLADIERAL